MPGVSGWLPLEVEESLKLKWFALVKKKKRKQKEKVKKKHGYIKFEFEFISPPTSRRQ